MPEKEGMAAQEGGAGGFKEAKEGGDVEAEVGNGDGGGNAVKMEGPRRLKRGVGGKGEGDGEGEGETHEKPIKSNSNQTAIKSNSNQERPLKSNNNQIEQEQAEVWSERLEELKTFMQVHNHDHVVCGESGNQELELWVVKQRSAFANRLLPLDRVRRLNSIGFHWKGSDARKQMAAVAAGGEGCENAPGVPWGEEAGDVNKKENGVRGARWAGSSRVAGRGQGGRGGGAGTRERQERSTRGIIDRYTPPKKKIQSSEDRCNPLKKKRRLGVEDGGREGREGGMEAGGMNGAKRTVEECGGGGGGGDGGGREREVEGRKDVASRGLGEGEGGTGGGGGGDTGGAGYRRQKRKAMEIIIHERAGGHGPV
jgi:hypothetical protein